jgi:hypothetical protein
MLAIACAAILGHSVNRGDQLPAIADNMADNLVRYLTEHGYPPAEVGKNKQLMVYVFGWMKGRFKEEGSLPRACLKRFA